MRPSKPEDSRAVRALIHEDTGDVEWTPERVAAGSALSEGQKVRLSIESAEPGYLYIIDRDQYADGTSSPPTLIFPTLKIRRGAGRVTPGMVVEVPDAEDNPPYFRVKRSRPDQISEVLTILVSPKPIPGLVIGEKPLRLTDAQVTSWEKQWNAKVYKLEAKGLEGNAYTNAEKEAGSGAKLLTGTDPVPQTMFRIESRPGDPVLLQLPLRTVK
jgi:hypothetical protein